MQRQVKTSAVMSASELLQSEAATPTRLEIVTSKDDTDRESGVRLGFTEKAGLCKRSGCVE
ncbi:MAG: hypothetical protein WC778_10205 [Negativicutes bacterium]